MKTALLASILALLSIPTFAPAALQDGEKGWRDPSPELRKHWDTIEGKPAPSLAGLSSWLNTEARAWKDLRGKVVLIDAWAWWCAPCRRSMPHLEELRAKHADKGFVVLGVHSASRYDSTKMRNAIGEMKLPWAFAVDRERTLSTALGTKLLPTYYLVDRSGKLRVAGVNRERVDDVVAAVVAEPWEKSEEPEAKVVEAVAPGTTWPAYVKKPLYAGKDLRGKQAPELQVEKWLTDAPDTEGKTVLIDFWATWCPPCREAIPHLNDFQKKFADDLVVIGISAEQPATVERFMKKTEMQYAQAIDTKARTKDAVDVQGIPHVLLISSDGIVRWQGFPESEEDRLTEQVVATVVALDKAAREKPKDEPDKKGDPKKGDGEEKQGGL
ncbi:MAG: TlpA family protein disulfide reductase [bacterium]|nr:TlpA family protein disulfide reductase [bacterium]